MNHLPPKGFGKLLHVMEAKRNITTIVRKVGGSKEIIPNTESEPEVHSIAMILRQVSGMMPDVHLRVIEEILQGTKREV